MLSRADSMGLRKVVKDHSGQLPGSGHLRRQPAGRAGYDVAADAGHGLVRRERWAVNSGFMTWQLCPQNWTVSMCSTARYVSWLPMTRFAMVMMAKNRPARRQAALRSKGGFSASAAVRLQGDADRNQNQPDEEHDGNRDERSNPM